ncbi:ML5 [Symbiodinium sp. CCMP2456]|nr:ML5 [Symbiodinium sp. CCMP2456]
MATAAPQIEFSFHDGSAVLVNRNSFLDVEIVSRGNRRSQSTPPHARYEHVVEAEINQSKPFARMLSGSTVSTDYRDCESPVDSEFERQTTRDSPCSANSDRDDLDLEDLHTVMIKNIPCRCSAEEVLRAVDSLGFAGTYDFFYLPMNRRHKQGIGYGFINFIELGTAVRFKEAIWGYRFPGRRSTKQVEIAVAQLQGRAEVEAYFSCTQVVHTRYRPLM